MDYAKAFAQALLALKAEGRYRVFADICRDCGSFPTAQHYTADRSRPITVWCSNDHLGMGQHPAVMAAMHQSIARSGVAAGGSRNISGNNHTLVQLEGEIADLHRKEAGLTFITGYAANDAILGVLGTILPDPVFFSDEQNHASIIRGIRATRAERKIFRHNDVDHLEQLLAESDPDRPRIVVFESIYSMDADIAPMAEICAVAKRFGALTYA